MNNNPIGVFDSGIGGLTVLKAIIELLPNENTVYLGDTARVPYGTKSRETVIRYSLENSSFLRDKGVKLIVAACNTASAYAIGELTTAFDIPVIGVIEPGARAAIEANSDGKIGVIGTEGTMGSHAYSKVISAIKKNAFVIEKACPLFVPLVEEGFMGEKATALIAEKYLEGLKKEDIDTLVLGCTHYPLLKEAISEVMGNSVRLVDSAESTAKEVKRLLMERGLERKTENNIGEHRFFVTDSPGRFVRVGRIFFGEHLPSPELTDLSKRAYKA